MLDWTCLPTIHSWAFDDITRPTLRWARCAGFTIPCQKSDLAAILDKESLMKNQGITTVIYPVRNLEKAKILYSQLLGIGPFMDRAYYVGFKVGDQEIGLDPNGHEQGMTGPVAFHQVENIMESLQNLLEAGADKYQDIRNAGEGKLIAAVTDPDGNIIGLIQLP
jgi:predicted enzyme related to lactoylglutathione lyase